MFYLFSLLIGTITILYLLQESKTRIPPIQFHWTILLVVGAILCIYLAPEGFDRHQYREMFETPNVWSGEKDSGWESYNSAYRLFLGKNSDAFFFIHDCIYTLFFVAFACAAFGKGFRFYFLLLLFISLGYYGGGTNVLRSGLAGAMIYFGLSRYLYCNSPQKGAIIFLCISGIAVTVHYSIILLILGLVLGYFFPKTKWYVCVWMCCVILSYFNVLEGVLSPIIHYLGATGDRLESYVSQIGERNEFYLKAGWRLDFIIYSAVPLVFAYYYIKVCNYKNKFYQCLLCGYLVANSFWLCVIRMPFTDRIALISWIIIPVITSFPVLTDSNIRRPSICLAGSYLFPLILCILNLI